MKSLIFFIILTGIVACKSAEIIPQKVTKMVKTSASGDYRIQEKMMVIPNQTLSVVKNELGQNYLKTLPGEHIVLKYTFMKTPKESGLMDAKYTENVWFEVKDKTLKTMDLTKKDLQKNPLYVQVYGFRNAKLFPVTDAEVHIKILDSHTAELFINIKDDNMLIHQKQIKQTLKF